MAGLAATGGMLALAASCVPVERDRGTADDRVARQAIRQAEPLLARLALDVPDLSEPAAVAPVPAAALVTPPPFVAGGAVDDRARALDCLTAAVYHEARSEGAAGQRAVAQVILNRVRDRAFPSSVCGVVYQGSTRSTGCQFSFTCDGSLRRPREPGAWGRAREVAAAALNGAVEAAVGSATHYHAGYVTPWWASSLRHVASVGSHVFYRWPGALGRALAFRQTYAGVEPGAGGAGPAAAVASVDSEGGAVTVHRGLSGPDARPASVTLAAGVRVHRNHRASGGDGEPQAWTGAYEVDGVGIGAEDGPI